jgi:hypothetical protein
MTAAAAAAAAAAIAIAAAAVALGGAWTAALSHAHVPRLPLGSYVCSSRVHVDR